MNRLTKVVSIHNNEPEFYEANIDLYPEMMGYEHQQAEMDCINKLGQLEDLEEELGCPLEVLFKALEEGITFEHKGVNLRSDSIRLFHFNQKWTMRTYAFIQGYGSNAYDLELNNYGKTWWLKGEKNV